MPANSRWNLMEFNSGFKGLIYYSKSALPVSGYVLAHHQEHLTVFTVSGSVHPSWCPLVSRMSWVFCGCLLAGTTCSISFPLTSSHRKLNSFGTPAGSNLGEHYQILLIQSSAPDDGLKHSPKHVELTWNNKLIYIVNLFGYFHSCITLPGFMYVKFRSVYVTAMTYSHAKHTKRFFYFRRRPSPYKRRLSYFVSLPLFQIAQ